MDAGFTAESAEEHRDFAFNQLVHFLCWSKENLPLPPGRLPLAGEQFFAVSKYKLYVAKPSIRNQNLVGRRAKIQSCI